MATKKGLIQEVMDSTPVKAAKGLVDKAVAVVQDPPAAPTPLTMKTARKGPKRASARKTGAKKAAPKMDRKLVSTMEDYEVKYLAQKWKVTQKAVKEAVAKVGHSRNKVEAELKAGKS